MTMIILPENNIWVRCQAIGWIGPDGLPSTKPHFIGCSQHDLPDTCIRIESRPDVLAE